MTAFVGVTLSEFQIEPIEGAYRETYAATARAAGQSVRTVGDDIVRKGRSKIKSAGQFKGRWVSGWRARYYPRGSKGSPNAKAVVKHSLGGLASVHEFGATIRGRPLLWIPVQGSRKTVGLNVDFAAGRINRGRARFTPKAVASAKGGLQYIKPAGGPPMLAYKTGGKRARLQPAFIGLRSVKIPARWGLLSVAEGEAQRLDAEFLKQFKAND